MEKALEMAELENAMGVCATYFVMLSSDFYNLLSKENEAILHKIKSLGHSIGLHFDETKYGDSLSDEELILAIKKEAAVLSHILGETIKSVSMHMPSERLYGHKLNLDLANAYDKEFVEGFKYLSDSMMRWREPALDIIASGKYFRIQLLTHPIWWGNESKFGADKILSCLYADKKKKMEHYLQLIKPGAQL